MKQSTSLFLKSNFLECLGLLETLFVQQNLTMQFYDFVSVNRANSRQACCELIYMNFPLRISISQN